MPYIHVLQGHYTTLFAIMQPQNIYHKIEIKNKDISHSQHSQHIKQIQFAKTVSRRKIFLYKVVPYFVSNVHAPALTRRCCGN